MTKRSTTGDGWGTPTHMAALSTSMTDLVSWVSADGCNLYLARDVTGQSSEIYWARKPM